MKIQLAALCKLTLIIIVFTMTACSNKQNNSPIDPSLPERVGLAESEKIEDLQKILSPYDAALGDPVFLRAFKEENILEIWVLPEGKEKYIRIRTYPICAASGKPGPKLKQGDKQVPEGFYHIAVFNPLSNFHLSLGINYPNNSDRYFADSESPGGDIYIHGSCMSIGCLAMTDDYIKEIYVICDRARRNGQKNIPVHIFPFQFGTTTEMELSKENPTLKERWNSLKKIDNYFVNNGKPANWEVDSKGQYHLTSN